MPRFASCLMLLFACACQAAPPATAGMPGQPPLILAGATIIDLEAGIQTGARWVTIRNGLIEAIGERQPAKVKDALVVDARGQYLMPGLAEMHAHLPAPSQGAGLRERVLFLYLAAGVTTARGMLGHPSHLELREAVHEYRELGPRIVTSGPSLNGRSVSSPGEAARMVRAQHEAGYDFVKIHPGLEVDEFDALAREAKALNMPFAGHVSLAVGLERAQAAGQATIDHLDSYMQALVPPGRDYDPDADGFFGAGLAELADARRIPSLAQSTAAAGVWNVPTQSLLENVMLPPGPDAMAARPEMRFMPAQTVADWRARKQKTLSSPGYDTERARRFIEIRRQLILALHKAGAGLLLGSDAPQIFNVPGFAAHRELAALVAAGLTPREALLTGTYNPAEFFNATDRFGAVREGLEADLVLLTADPTQDIANIGAIAGVVARGRWLSRDFIDARLANYDRGRP